MRAALRVAALVVKVRVDGEQFLVRGKILCDSKSMKCLYYSPWVSRRSTVIGMMRLYLEVPMLAVASKLTGWHSSVLCVCVCVCPVFGWVMDQKGHSNTSIDSMYLCLWMSFPFLWFSEVCLTVDWSSVGLDYSNYLQLWLEGTKLWRNSSVS